MEFDKPLMFNVAARSGPANIIREEYGWDYWNDEFQLGGEVWPFSWLGFQGALGFEQTAGTQAVEGSQRWLGNLELSSRLRVPVRFLDHLYFSPTLRGTIGKSQLNFGTGRKPEMASDLLWGYGGRGGIFMAVMEDVGVDIFVGFENGRSVARNYREESYFVGVGLMSGRLPPFESIIGE